MTPSPVGAVRGPQPGRFPRSPPLGPRIQTGAGSVRIVEAEWQPHVRPGPPRLEDGSRAQGTLERALAVSTTAFFCAGLRSGWVSVSAIDAAGNEQIVTFTKVFRA